MLVVGCFTAEAENVISFRRTIVGDLYWGCASRESDVTTPKTKGQVDQHEIAKGECKLALLWNRYTQHPQRSKWPSNIEALTDLQHVIGGQM